MSWIAQNTNTEPERPAPAAAPAPHTAAAPLASPRGERPEMTQMANIGKSLQIKGELSGNEDLTIDGSVEGKILLNGHNLAIGQSGRVVAEVGAKTVVVGGDLKGNIAAEDKVEVSATGSMKGDIRAPRVVLADGARFKGSIDMGGEGAAVPRPAAAAAGKPPSA
jgi:cytoskeletal protein CcmA (bactofilin family)